MRVTGNESPDPPNLVQRMFGGFLSELGVGDNIDNDKSLLSSNER
jgi:hypothetical protein